MFHIVTVAFNISEITTIANASEVFMSWMDCTKINYANKYAILFVTWHHMMLLEAVVGRVVLEDLKLYLNSKTNRSSLKNLTKEKLHLVSQVHYVVNCAMKVLHNLKQVIFRIQIIMTIHNHKGCYYWIMFNITLQSNFKVKPK